MKNTGISSKKTELKGKSEEERCLYFLLCLGEKGRKVYKTLNLPDETETNDEGETVWKRTTMEIKTAFKIYCNPKKTSRLKDTSSTNETKSKGSLLINTPQC